MTEYQWVHSAVTFLGVIAWPLLVGIIAVAFHKPLSRLIQSVSKVSAGPVSVEIDKTLAKTTASFVRLVEDSGGPSSRWVEAQDLYSVTTSLEGSFPASDPTGFTEPDRPEPVAPVKYSPPPLREYYASQAEEHPKTAILLAYIQLEKWYDFTLRSHGLPIFDGTKRRSARTMSRVAVEEGMLPASSIDTVDGLSLMRDLVLAKQGEEVSPQQAREFLVLTDGVIYTLRAELTKYEIEHPPIDVEEPLGY